MEPRVFLGETCGKYVGVQGHNLMGNSDVFDGLAMTLTVQAQRIQMGKACEIL